MPLRRLWTVAVVCLVACLGGMTSVAHASISVTLFWTAPGDDGTLGAVRRYDVRWSTEPITEQNFASANALLRPPAPREAGNVQIATIGGLQEGRSYFFAVKAVDEAGNWSPISNVAVYTSAVVDVGGRPASLVFSAPYPNPARHGTRFLVQLPEPGPVRVDVFDLAGRRVRTLFDGHSGDLRAELEWDLRDGSGAPVPAGVYLVRGQLPGQTITRRALVVR